ncbi:hypothetical protein AB9P05_14255 [Roseivirga sp. BDSF3-8]|uniref:hypothetical protein n=1 Tax=Roseivirga sp. BDSF3-8 TaxID=3241598 RepID=UPI003531D4A6
MSKNNKKLRLQEFEIMSFVLDRQHRWGGRADQVAESENEEACNLKTIAPTCMTCLQDVCGQSNDGICTYYDRDCQPYQ